MLFCTEQLWLHRDGGPIDWQVSAGEHWAVVGASGAGKTQLAAILAGAREPERGAVHWCDPRPGLMAANFEAQQAFMEHDRRFDDSELRADACDPGTPVAQHILGGRPADACFEALVDALQLRHILTRGLRFVSSGEGRKALLARVLCQQPDILVLDEPADSLDAASQAALPGWLAQYITPAQALLWLTRDAQALPTHITHVLYLEQGRVQYCGPKAGFVPPAAPAVQVLPVALPAPLHPPPASTELVRMAGLALCYGDTRVLRDIHWACRRGEHTQVAGPNGAGKSTLLSLISGDNHHGYGQPLWLFGMKRGSGETVWDIKRHIGLLSNDLHLNYVRGYSVLEVVASGAMDSIGIYQVIPDTVLRLAKHWLAALGMAGWESRRFSALGFGEQRRVLLARAVVKSPALLLLDEPTVGLAASDRALLLQLVDHIALAGHSTFIMTTHRADERPACLVQVLQLEPAGDGGYSGVVRAM